MPATPACTLTGEQEEGPYYVDGPKLRPDVTEGRPGVPPQLRIALLDAKKCNPLEGAAVDIWHCDAVGVYSALTAMGSAGRGAPGANGPGRMGSNLRRGRGPDDFGGPWQLDETRFLRGVQLTGPAGIVDFTTIYPGWYQGRTLHIHLKIHLGGSSRETYDGGHIAHTGQLFLPEEVTAEVARMKPCETNSGVHRTLRNEDMIFRSQHGSEGIVTLERLRPGSGADGFLATATLAVDPEATPARVSAGRGQGN